LEYKLVGEVEIPLLFLCEWIQRHQQRNFVDEVRDVHVVFAHREWILDLIVVTLILEEVEQRKWILS